MRGNPSPPTSASTLSSSFGGGSSDPPHTTTVLESELARKDEWASELQPIPSGLEAVTGGGGRCALGLEFWDSMLSESATPNHEQDLSLLRWIAGDVDESSFGLKQLLQGGNNNLDLDGNAGLGIVDQGPGVFETIGGVSCTGNLIASVNHNPNFLAYSGSVGFANIGNGNSNSNNGNGKIGGTSTSSSGVLNYKVPSVALNSSSNNSCNIQNSAFTCSANSLTLPVTLPPGVIYQRQFEAPDEKPQVLNPQVLISEHQHSQNPNLIPPLSFAQQEQQLLRPPQPKRHNSVGFEPIAQIPKVQFAEAEHEFILRKHRQLQQQQQQSQHLGFSPGVQFVPQHLLQQHKSPMVPKQKMGPGEEDMAHHRHHQHQQQLALLDQLYKAAELLGTGNFSHAQGILARLNHQLSPVGKPLHRAAFYFKEALQLLLLMNNPVTSPPPRTPTPFDVIFKMSAYKVFSEVSPLIQFINFTCNQALLEALDDAGRIHIVDFDIGFGAQWASFMQELPVRNMGTPSLKITAFASPYTHHPVELNLMRENLTQFANEIGISFVLEVVNFDCLDQSSYSLPILRATENEAVAVNFPIWSSSNQPAVLPSLLRFVKQLSPKIVVSLDRGCDRSDLPFPQHVLQALHSYVNLLESLDAADVTLDALYKIERFLLQPKIERTVLGRLRAPDKMPLWKTLFASAGFFPVTFSNFTETQAECLVKRTSVRGFHVEKCQASLTLYWQRRELISASAWRC